MVGKLSEVDHKSNRWSAYLLLFIVIFSTGWSLGSTLLRRADVPARHTWDQAAEYVKSSLQPDDLVTWYPEWAGEAKLSLHGLPVMIMPHQGQIDLASGNRLWVIGGFGYDGKVLAAGDHIQTLQKLKLRSYKEFSSPQAGRVSVTLLDIEGQKIRHSLFKDLDHSSKVQVIRSKRSHQIPSQQCDFWALNGWHCQPQSTSQRKRVRQCLARPQKEQLKKRSKRRDLYTLDRRRWLPYIDCKLNPTEHVSRDWRVIDEVPRRCISLSPHYQKKTVLSWTIEASDQKQSLWFKYGWEDLAVRHPFRQSKAHPIHVDIHHGQEHLFSEELKPIQGWFTEKIKLSPSHLMGPPQPITISYEAPSGVEDAIFCISLSVRSHT